MKRITIIEKNTITLANTLSVFALILWVVGIWLIAKWEYHIAFGTILVWVICDMFDGYFARKYKTVSNFGKMLDNFADIFLYVFSIVFLYFSKFDIDILSWIVLILFLLCSVYRLSYFFEHGLLEKKESSYYIGMPVYFHLILFQLILAPIGNIFMMFSLWIFSIWMISWFHFKKFGIIVGLTYLGVLAIINNMSYLWLY